MNAPPPRGARSRPLVTLATLLARRRLVLAVAALLVLAALPGVVRLESDNSPAVFYLAGTPELARYRAMLADFGSDEGVRLVVEGPGLWTRPGLAWLGELERRVAALPGVEAVAGLATRHGRDGWPPEDPGALREVARADRLDRAFGWIDERGEVVTTLVLARPSDPVAQRRLFAALEGELATAPDGVRGQLIGSRSIDAALDESAAEIGRRYFPLLVLFAALLLAASFREARAVVLPLAFVGACELLLLGAMGYAGVRLNLILAILPPIVFVIALASAVHLLLACRDREAEGMDGVAATLSTYADKGRAVAWTTLSTGVGFAALAVSPVGPVRALGIWAGVGIGLLGVGAFTLYPCLLALTHGRPGELPERRIERLAQRLGRALAGAAPRHRTAVVLLYAGTAVAALAGVPRLRVESNALAFLPADHPVRERTAALEARGIGVSTVELLLTARPDAPGLDSPAALAGLLALADALRAEPALLGALSAGELLEAAARDSPLAGFLPDEALRAGALAALRADPPAARLLAPLLTADGRRARMTLFVRTAGAEAIAPLRARAEAAARAAFPEAEVTLSGQYLLLLDMQRYLLSTLAGSLAVTVPVLFATFLLLLRRVGLALRALAPNLWPVLAVFGLMGWTGVPLDVATVMVASVTLGLVVDDTIHTLAHYREEHERLGSAEAIAGRLEQTAPAYLLTGLILIGGFGVCALSDFAPTARFGILSAAAIAVALAADLLLVPVLFGGEASRPEA